MGCLLALSNDFRSGQFSLFADREAERNETKRHHCGRTGFRDRRNSMGDPRVPRIGIPSDEGVAGVYDVAPVNARGKVHWIHKGSRPEGKTVAESDTAGKIFNSGANKSARTSPIEGAAKAAKAI